MPEWPPAGLAGGADGFLGEFPLHLTIYVLLTCPALLVHFAIMDATCNGRALHSNVRNSPKLETIYHVS